jgi:hypothetical protein
MLQTHAFPFSFKIFHAMTFLITMFRKNEIHHLITEVKETKS